MSGAGVGVGVGSSEGCTGQGGSVAEEMVVWVTWVVGDTVWAGGGG